MSDDAGGVSDEIGAGPAVRRLSEWHDESLVELTAEYGSPLYVLDLERVRENYRRLAAAFPETEILYALKANALGDVLETLRSEGAGLECASAGEVYRALESGASGSEIHYTAVNPPAVDLEYVLEQAASEPKLTITAGSTDTIDRLEERGYDGRLCLRVNPGIGAGHHEKVETGGHAKFGVPAERAEEILVDAAERGFDVVGIHAHVGSGVSGEALDSHREFVSRVGATARAVEERVGSLEFVDVGGGFGVPYRNEEPPLDIEAVAAATRSALGEVDAALAIEPGRYLVADAGVLVTDVNTVKRTAETTVVGVDAGMTTLLRPAMYDAYHPIRNLSAAVEPEPRPAVEQTVAGPICESADVFCTDRPLPNPDREDVLAIGNAGAYGYEMASQYNSRPRPASVVLADGTTRFEDRPEPARRRETIGDVTRVERDRQVDETASATQYETPDH